MEISFSFFSSFARGFQIRQWMNEPTKQHRQVVRDVARIFALNEIRYRSTLGVIAAEYS